MPKMPNSALPTVRCFIKWLRYCDYWNPAGGSASRATRAFFAIGLVVGCVSFILSRSSAEEKKGNPVKDCPMWLLFDCHVSDVLQLCQITPNVLF